MPKVVVFNKIGEADVLEIVDQAVPAPQDDEVQIRVHAIGLNRAEIMFRRGQYVFQPEFPAKTGYEASGVITQVGKNVPSHLHLGDSVSIFPGFPIGRWGTYGEVINIPAKDVINNLKNSSHEENAALWMQYGTAYGAIVTFANVQPGQYVVIRAASSSVGIAAIQIVNALGAIPIAVTRGQDKVQQLIEYGAKYVVTSDTQDIYTEINRIISENNGNLHLVFDPVGGKEVTTFVKLLSYGGFFLQYGALDHSDLSIPVFELLSKALTIYGYLIPEARKTPEYLPKLIDFVHKGLESGKLKPVIDKKTFTFNDIAKAQDYMETNQQVGKIIVTVPQEGSTN